MNSLNILFGRTSIPETSTSAHGYFYEKALRTHHNVITYGPDLPEYMYERLNFVRTGKIQHADVPYFTEELEGVLAKLPWMPDFFLWTDNFYWFLLNGFKKLPFPTACFLLDPQYIPELKIEMARHFDHVFVSQKTEVERYKKAGLADVYWLTHACDPAVHGKRPSEKIYDISFVGTLNPRREEMMRALQARFNVHYERCFGERMAEVYSSSKIIFNVSTVNEINMRIFEAMASGAMLLTDEAPGSGLAELFDDKKHLVFYRNGEELLALTDYYLRHDGERERIALAGMQEVLERHTYDCRVREMVEKIFASENPRSRKAHHDYMMKKNEQGFEKNGLMGYQEAINKGLDTAETYIGLGAFLRNNGQLEDALACYKKALALDKNDATAYNSIGVIFKEKGLIGEAVTAYHEAIERDPEYADAYYNLGNIFQYQGDNDKAIACYLKAIGMCPHHSSAYNNLAAVFLETGRFDKHMEYLREALRNLS